MNYSHAFHAGNFADVFKHAVLARLLDYLKRKEAAFRVVDTHAGTGLYDLSSPEAQRTGEYVDAADVQSELERMLEAARSKKAAD